ncbi:methyl-accepting chemotaxis protein [Solimicrobium silvestre]|uniref:Methyl-accepting chemotaxis protein (MCP) signaling domain n=1 Tax=Solimicrobium silvestre TaxID=2099400 RepID=A0A2S9GUW6_9BURK|nr:methyl-accepting chemotaxis protein [Solimicrobium silvestre]PRC91501.1 Methyl-accepting chemotaxis protein (MCP) signaling domain [Solimicrobium silvestre]
MKAADFKIGIRLGFLAGFLMFTMFGTGLAGWYTFAQMRAIDIETMNKASLLQESIDTARTAQVEFKKQVQEWKDTLLRGNDPASFDKYSKAFLKQSDLTQTNLHKLKDQFVKLGLDTKQVDETLSMHAELGVKYSTALKQYDIKNPDSSHVVDALVKGMDRPPTKKIDDIVAYVFDQSKQMMAARSTESEGRYQSGVRLQLIVILLAGSVGCVTTVLLIRSIVVPLRLAVEVAERVAEGDLTSHIEVTSKDETGQLMQALLKMNDNLLHIVNDVRISADTIAHATHEIATANMDLSGRTETQAGALEETASSMEELTSTIKQNSQNSQQANKLAQTASEIAIRGGVRMSQVVTTIGSINESSRKIVDIISVIDGIAFQTNILALNAAVEAARAGEQGRGFAVVAAEVRNLAQRSASAAKEIKELISDSVEKVEAGSKLVNQAGSTMNEVQESIQRVTDIVAEISLASREQAQGIEQIQQAISAMDDVTQQNAALVEEAAAAAASLSEQANSLTTVVSVFKLENESKNNAQSRSTFNLQQGVPRIGSKSPSGRR